MLGVAFGQKQYVLTVLKDVEDEVRRNPTLRFQYPWFDSVEISTERLAQQMRLSKSERQTLEITQSIIHGTVLNDIGKYMTKGRSPPSAVDCNVLAFGQIRPAIVVTDDLGMHLLAEEFDLPVWHGCELLAKMLTAQMVNKDKVREIYHALEANLDLTETWKIAKHSTFVKIFGKVSEQHV